MGELFFSSYTIILTRLNRVGYLLDRVNKYADPLKTFASIQEALNLINSTREMIAQQREIRNNFLIELRKFMEIPETVKIGTDITQNLNQQKQELTTIQQSEKTIEEKKQQLDINKNKINELLKQYNEDLKKIGEKYLVDLQEEMNKKINMPLSDSDIIILRDNISSTTSNKQKLDALKKLDIKIPNNASEFDIATYNAIVSTLQKNFKTADNSKTTEIVKQISANTNADKANDELLKNLKNKCTEIIQSIRETKDAVKNIQFQSLDTVQLEITKNQKMLKEQIQKISTAENAPKKQD